MPKRRPPLVVDGVVQVDRLSEDGLYARGAEIERTPRPFRGTGWYRLIDGERLELLGRFVWPTQWVPHTATVRLFRTEATPPDWFREVEEELEPRAGAEGQELIEQFLDHWRGRAPTYAVITPTYDLGERPDFLEADKRLRELLPDFEATQGRQS